MEILDMITDIAVIVTAVVAVVTLVLSIVKQIIHSKPAPRRRKLEYVNDFGDFIVNNGTGSMKIKKITFLYDGKEVDADSLVKLYREKLGYTGELRCITYLHNDELIDRALGHNEEIKLFEINPQELSVKFDGYLLEKLEEIRRHIIIKIRYQTILGVIKTTELK